MAPEHLNTDVDVLREMVRLAERRRNEELDALEKVNKYNLALIAFSGSFLSLLISTGLDVYIVRISGFALVLSILSSLSAIRPKILKGGAISIEDDVTSIKKGGNLNIQRYLVDVAELTNMAAISITKHTQEKRRWTIASASFLAFSLGITYILYAYA